MVSIAHRPTEREFIDAMTEFLVRGIIDHAHGAAAPESSPTSRGSALLDRLRQLAALKESGTLTEPEFTAAKAILLARS